MTKQGCCFERPNFIMANSNRNIIRWTVAAAGRWLLVQDLVAGAGLDFWCKTASCCCRKVIAGAGLVAAGAGLVAAGAGR